MFYEKNGNHSLSFIRKMEIILLFIEEMEINLVFIRKMEFSKFYKKNGNLLSFIGFFEERRKRKTRLYFLIQVLRKREKRKKRKKIPNPFLLCLVWYLGHLLGFLNPFLCFQLPHHL